MSTYSAWLHSVSARGGSFDEIDSRTLGCVADEIDAMEGRIKELEAWLDACLGLVRGDGPPNWDGIREALSKEYSPLPTPGYQRRS